MMTLRRFMYQGALDDEIEPSNYEVSILVLGKSLPTSVPVISGRSGLWSIRNYATLGRFVSSHRDEFNAFYSGQSGRFYPVLSVSGLAGAWK